MRSVSPRCAVGVVITLTALAFTNEARAAGDCPIVPFARLPETASHFAEPVPLVLTAGALVTPLAFVPTGLDHELRIVAQRELGGRHDLEPVSVIAPYVLAGGVAVAYGVSLLVDACEWQRPEAAMLEAMTLTFGTVALLKWAAGRGWPNAGGDPAAADRLEHPEWAERFEPFDNGFGAWPSGHTAVAFSAAAALRTSMAELGWPVWLGYPIATAIGVGMWLGDHHFASDVISGALLGEAIGASTGKAFARTEREPEMTLTTPPFGSGIVVVYMRSW